MFQQAEVKIPTKHSTNLTSIVKAANTVTLELGYGGYSPQNDMKTI